MDTATRVQILDENDCISNCTNTLGRGMNPVIQPSSKIVGHTRFFNLGEATSLGEGKLWIQTFALKIDLVSYPVWAEGLVIMNLSLSLSLSHTHTHTHTHSRHLLFYWDLSIQVFIKLVIILQSKSVLSSFVYNRFFFLSMTAIFIVVVVTTCRISDLVRCYNTTHLSSSLQG